MGICNKCRFPANNVNNVTYKIIDDHLGVRAVMCSLCNKKPLKTRGVSNGIRTKRCAK